MFQKKGTPARSEALHNGRQTTRENETVIAAGVRIQGEFKAGSNVELRGTMEGSCETSGVLAVRETGRLVGSVTASSVRVEGEVEGDIAATGRVEICSTGKVRGDVQARAVSISDGAFFQGKVHMANDESPAAEGDKQEQEMAYAATGDRLA